jgi:hypothetical protein
LSFVRSCAALLKFCLQRLITLLVEPEILADYVTKFALVIAHQGPSINLEDQAANGRSDLDIFGIDCASIGNFDCAGDALSFGQCVPFIQRLFQVNPQASSLSKYFATSGYATLPGFKLVKIQAGIPVELTDRILPTLVGTVDGKGDEVVNDQFDVLFGPVGRRTARVDTATSAHPNAETFTRNHQKQRLSFGSSFLPGIVQVGHPRDLHPARLTRLRSDLPVDCSEGLLVEYHVSRYRLSKGALPVSARHEQARGQQDSGCGFQFEYRRHDLKTP